MKNGRLQKSQKYQCSRLGLGDGSGFVVVLPQWGQAGPDAIPAP
jgi:hypothetical protein